MEIIVIAARPEGAPLAPEAEKDSECQLIMVETLDACRNLPEDVLNRSLLLAAKFCFGWRNITCETNPLAVFLGKMM